MYAIEFQTTVKEDGSIDIPSEYRQHLKGAVRVIILTLEPTNKPSIIQQLLSHPHPVTDSTPFTRDEIYSEDMHNGLIVENILTIINPFRTP